MMNKIVFLLVTIMTGCMTMVNAKINYVPLYIIDTQPDVKEVKHAPDFPLFITQENHRLRLPEVGDSLSFMLLQDNICVYELDKANLQSTVDLPLSLVGDYEVRLSANTYYYHGFLTLDHYDKLSIPTETGLWENITLLGSNTSQEVILDNIMGLNVVEYNMKMSSNSRNDDILIYLNEEEKDAYLKYLEEKEAQLRAQRRIGLLPDELRAVFPQVVHVEQDGTVGINYLDLVPVLFCCIQELKIQLDSRTEKMVDIMMSRGAGPSSVREIRAAIGNTLLSVAPSSVNEPAQVRFLLSDDATDAYVTVTDMGGIVMTKVPVSPSDTSVSISSNSLVEGIYLCSLIVNGQNIGNKRLVKTK